MTVTWCSYNITEYRIKDIITSGLLGEVAMFVLRNAGQYIINVYSLRNALKGLYAAAMRGPIALIARETNGSIIGLAGIMFGKNEEERNTASGFIVTAKEVRGHGLGRSLLQRSIAISKEAGATYTANIDESNAPSKRTADSVGMHATGAHNEGHHRILEYIV